MLTVINTERHGRWERRWTMILSHGMKIVYEVYCASQRLGDDNVSRKLIISLCGIFASIFLVIVAELVMIII